MNYVVDCSLTSLPQYLEQAQQVGLMSDDHSYIIMNPDFQTVDIEPYKHGGSNITGNKITTKTIDLTITRRRVRAQKCLSPKIRCYIPGIRFFDPSLETITNFIKSINEKVTELSEGQIENAIPEDGLTFNLALIHDSVTLYTSAINSIGLEEGANVSCESKSSWNFGSTIINHIRTVSVLHKQKDKFEHT